MNTIPFRNRFTPSINTFKNIERIRYKIEYISTFKNVPTFRFRSFFQRYKDMYEIHIFDTKKPEIYISAEEHPSAYYIPIANNITFSLDAETTVSSNNPILTASWAAFNVLKFQEHCFSHNLKLICIEDRDISKESYESLIDFFESNNLFKTSFLDYDMEAYEYIDLTKVLIDISVRHKKQTDTYFYSIRKLYCIEDFYNIFKHFIEGPKEEAKITWITSFDSNENPRTTSLPVVISNAYNPLAYPTLKDSLSDFIKDFKESTATVLLMTSKPGAGKSSLIKHMLKELKESCLITYSDELKNMDALFAYFMTSHENFLIIEDADAYLTSRERDSSNFSMKKLLNITDGLTSNSNKKIIFTANFINLNNVDPALKRPGRCYKIIDFPYLTYQQALDFFKSEKDGTIPELFQHNKKEYSLASLYQYLNGYDPSLIEEDNSFNPSFGFTV